jgi:hypothetical protein
MGLRRNGGLVQKFCLEPECAEEPVVLLAEKAFCRTHYLAFCYRRLEAIAKALGVRNYEMTADEADAAGRFLQDCMRSAADFAGSQQTPSNLEKAQVYDVLLWASELHGRLRRSPRKNVKFPIVLRSDIPGRLWEIRTDTHVVSRHGMRLTCSADIQPKDRLTCIRLDTGRRAEAIVAWTRRTDGDSTEAGVEFVNEENFWDITWAGPPEAASGSRR